MEKLKLSMWYACQNELTSTSNAPEVYLPALKVLCIMPLCNFKISFKIQHFLSIQSLTKIIISDPRPSSKYFSKILERVARNATSLRGPSNFWFKT